jgi:hypothetical protein
MASNGGFNQIKEHPEEITALPGRILGLLI